MNVHMTPEQAKELGRHLTRVKHALEGEGEWGRDIDWSELAKPIEIDPGLLRKLAKGQRTGMNWETAVKLARGFGNEVMKILGYDPDVPPLFQLKNAGKG